MDSKTDKVLQLLCWYCLLHVVISNTKVKTVFFSTNHAYRSSISFYIICKDKQKLHTLKSYKKPWLTNLSKNMVESRQVPILFCTRRKYCTKLKCTDSSWVSEVLTID